MNKEQEHWAEQMRIKDAGLCVALQNLKFFEDKLGRKHSVVCEFREYAKMYFDEFEAVQKEFHKCGGMEACFAQLEEEGIINEIPE